MRLAGETGVAIGFGIGLGLGIEANHMECEDETVDRNRVGPCRLTTDLNPIDTDSDSDIGADIGESKNRKTTKPGAPRKLAGCGSVGSLFILSMVP